MPSLKLQAQCTNGEAVSDSGHIGGHHDRDRPHIGGRFADRLSVQSMVRVFFADAGSGGKESVCGRHAVRHADGPARGHCCDESDDFDADGTDHEAVEGTLSRFDICTDYASSLYIEQPERHPAVGGWDGGLHVVRISHHGEYDRDDGEYGPDDSE